MNNEHVLVTGNMLCLVPYLPQHVPCYHEWMASADLRENTASERLTLEEEYINQREWLCAEDKLTFIILAPFSLVATERVLSNGHIGGKEGTSFVKNNVAKGVGKDMSAGEFGNNNKKDNNNNNNNNNFTAYTQRLGESMCTFSLPLVSQGHDTYSISSLVCNTEKEGADHTRQTTYVMVGDCNLFRLNKYEVIDAMEEKEGVGCMNSVSAGEFFELSVMVANCAFRRRGVGEEALRLIMSYAIDKLDATCFVAKVLKSNTPSIHLFMSKLGFKLMKDVVVFNELHLVRYFVTEQEKDELKKTAGYKLGVYNEMTEKEMKVLEFLPTGE